MTIKITSEQIRDICTKISTSQIQAVNNIVMFVGHAHSGHSLIGALLDSHPQAAISNHVNLPKLILDHELSKQQLLKILLFHALTNNAEQAWINTGYSYKTESGFQGNVHKPLVLGDKQGGASTRVIMNNPELLDKLLQLFADKLKIIFVHRNAFDNIAAFSYYMKEDLSQKHIERYFENLDSVYRIKEQVQPENWFELSHEDFIDSPDKKLENLFDFLAIKQLDDLSVLTEIVNKKPNSRQKDINWTSEQKKYILQRLRAYEK